MRLLILPLLSLVSTAAIAQFSIRPQIGMEALRTKIQLNDLSAFTPSGVQFGPRVGLRMAYQLKTGHGAFVGATTGSPALQFKFTDPQAARTSFTAGANAMQLRLEGGYQYTSKAIRLSKPSAKTNSMGGSTYGGYGNRKQHGCGGHAGCGMRNPFNERSVYAGRARKDKGLYMRIQPSVGVAFASLQTGIETQTKGSTTTYQYNAGWNTALIAGTAFEFGSRKQTRFTVSINYLKSVGDNSQTLYTGSAKDLATTFNSATSGFNVGVGVPLRFGKKTVAPPPPPMYHRSPYHGRCGQNKSFGQ